MRIDIHHHLLQSRRNAAAEKPTWWEKPLWAGFVLLMSRPWAYRLATRFAPLGMALHKLVNGTALDPVGAWTRTRNFPVPQARRFRDAWREEAGS